MLLGFAVWVDVSSRFEVLGFVWCSRWVIVLCGVCVVLFVCRLVCLPLFALLLGLTGVAWLGSVLVASVGVIVDK